MKGVKPLLEKLIQTDNSVPKDAFSPRKDRFAMNLIHMPRDEIFSIIGGVWYPGQTTPIHDHLTWAIIGVYEGEEREALFRRTDDGSNPEIAKIEKVSEKINKKGHVTVLGNHGIHRVDTYRISQPRAFTSTGVILAVPNVTAMTLLREKLAGLSADTAMSYETPKNSSYSAIPTWNGRSGSSCSFQDIKRIHSHKLVHAFR